MYNFAKPYFKVDRNIFKGLHLIPEWNVNICHFGSAYQYQSTFQISLNSGEAVFFFFFFFLKHLVLKNESENENKMVQLFHASIHLKF